EPEYYAESAICTTCGAAVRMKDLAPDEIETLENQNSYREAQTELSWLRRVTAFYQRYPDQEGRIKPHFMELIDSDDERVQDDLMAGIPFNEIELPAGDASLAETERNWTAEDRAVIDYLRHTWFDLSSRLRFVEEQITTLEPIFQARSVRCPKCGGKLQ